MILGESKGLITFYKTGTNHRILLRIVKLIGQIGGEKAISLLEKKLDHPNEEIAQNGLMLARSRLGNSKKKKDQ